MTEKELQQLINQGESQTLDFKDNHIHPRSSGGNQIAVVRPKKKPSIRYSVGNNENEKTRKRENETG